MTRPTVTVYTRRGCHLCRDAEAVVRRVATGRADVVLVDVDANPELTERYTVRVPVVEVDGEEVAQYELAEAELVRALERAASSSNGQVVDHEEPPPAPRSRIPWVGVGLHGVLALFPYGVTTLLAPPWGVAVLYAAWTALLVWGVRLARRRSPLAVVLPGFGLVAWFLILLVGDVVFGWTA